MAPLRQHLPRWRLGALQLLRRGAVVLSASAMQNDDSKLPGYRRRILQLDAPVCSPRELFRRAVEIDFDNSTPAPMPPAPPHPGRTRAMRDRIGVGVLRSGRTWTMFNVG